MIDLSHCIELGSISKTHGVHGQIALHLKHIGFNHIKNMESVFILIDGLPVPFFITSYREGNNGILIIELEDINTESKAKELIGNDLWLHSGSLTQVEPSDDINGLPNQLVGYRVLDVKLGLLGILNDILDFDQNPLLQIKQGKKEILLPLQPEFILEIDDSQKTIQVQTPEGLTDLF